MPLAVAAALGCECRPGNESEGEDDDQRRLEPASKRPMERRIGQCSAGTRLVPSQYAMCNLPAARLTGMSPHPAPWLCVPGSPRVCLCRSPQLRRLPPRLASGRHSCYSADVRHPGHRYDPVRRGPSRTAPDRSAANGGLLTRVGVADLDPEGGELVPEGVGGGPVPSLACRGAALEQLCGALRQRRLTGDGRVER